MLYNDIYTPRDNLNEIEFLLHICELVNDKNFRIKKTEYRYCPVDFELFYNDVSIGYIELKCRYSPISTYPTFIIAKKKLDKILDRYDNTILVFIDKNKDTVYFYPIIRPLENFDVRPDIYEKDVYHIQKNSCVFGLRQLISHITQLLYE